MKSINHSDRPSHTLMQNPVVERIAYPLNTQPNRTGLTAKWEIIDNKLVCKWHLV
ncbi:hypothetical protein H6G89_06285 [Oscillatoria sp. FACHB-1407]|uniref:hypothetical protein n=1 Tax=Oscillatoria sp. FACHB-1407 TaxID=2692847 RepID=UPI001682878C|nr:hypothetical protein [Oscillatoria sp. FACHB-1407]MBD2460649.1 hypothetical protein [Oscillatoria sp. FACHB-1407]